MTSRPGSLREAIATRFESRPAAELLRPHVAATRTTATMVTSSKPIIEPATLEPPLVRTSAEDMPGEPVVASSWRALPRDGDGPAIVSIDSDAGASTGHEPEKLHTPQLVEQPIHTEVVGPHPGFHGHGHIVMHGHKGMFVADLPREGNKAALPPYIIEPPDILEVQLLRDPKRVPQPINGQFLVRPDGTITVGVYGSAHVAGLTLEAAKAEIVKLLSSRLEEYEITDDTGKKRKIKVEDEVVVDILEYATKYCYVIADGAGYGASVARIPITGSDTVLDALGKLGGVPPQAAKQKIWLARPATGHKLPIDWAGISQRAEVATNYQVFPGDRIYVKADPWLVFDAYVGKFINPFEHITGGVLLGASAKNALRQRSSTSSTGR